VIPYVAGFVTGLRRGVGARGELLVRLLFFGVILVVMHALWSAAVEGRGGSLAGYDARGLAWYILGAQAAVLGPRPRTIEDVGLEIGSGEVAIAMLRPVSVVTLRMSFEWGEAVVRVVAACALGVPETWLLAGRPPNLAVLAVLVPAAALGALVSIVAQHAFAAAAFWLDDAKGTWFLYQKLIFLLGGLLLPLEVLPSGVSAVARLLPFATMAYLPGRIASGHLSPSLLAGALAWLVAFALGERRLQAVGG
jgi:ABC-2 type transport system permease protein